ncbi:MAG: hypothetical protein LBD63_00890 [Mycoplasmataceae bacterium]|nr:hypothetical protein [Mycoplasmataceae bacterium]
MSHNIYRILVIPPREFADELETIRAICQKYNTKELTNEATNELLIHFDNIKSWKNCCEEIQLTVDEIVFKTHSKYTIIKKTMKQAVDPTQAPEWFLAFQKQVLTFQEFTVQQFKK